MKRTRRNHGATFKTQVAVAAIKGDKTLGELAAQFSVHSSQITKWKQQLLARAADVFGGTKVALENDCFGASGFSTDRDRARRSGSRWP